MPFEFSSGDPPSLRVVARLLEIRNNYFLSQAAALLERQLRLRLVTLLR